MISSDRDKFNLVVCLLRAKSPAYSCKSTHCVPCCRKGVTQVLTHDIIWAAEPVACWRQFQAEPLAPVSKAK